MVNLFVVVTELITLKSFICSKNSKAGACIVNEKRGIIYFEISRDTLMYPKKPMFEIRYPYQDTWI